MGWKRATPAAVTPLIPVSGPAAVSVWNDRQSRCPCGALQKLWLPLEPRALARIIARKVTFGEVRSLVGPHVTPRAIAEFLLGELRHCRVIRLQFGAVCRRGYAKSRSGDWCRTTTGRPRPSTGVMKSGSSAESVGTKSANGLSSGSTGGFSLPPSPSPRPGRLRARRW